MIKFEYIPWAPNSDVAELFDPPPVESVTMTLGDDVSWDEAVCEFKNFLRASGYVIPYDFEDDYVDCSDPPDMDKSGSLGDRQPEWAMRMSGEYDQTALDLCNKCGWKTVVPDDGCLNCNRAVASEDESNTDVAEKREWISLNIFDRNRILDEWNTTDTTIHTLCAIIETKLKEKNT